MNCPTSGFPTIQHIELHKFTASLLSEVCHNVSVEPQPQPLTGGTFPLTLANVKDGACLDVAASGFWAGCYQMLRYLILIFHPTYRASFLKD